MTFYDHSASFERLLDGGPPPHSWGGPARPLPPRPMPRHLTNPAPARRWGTDLATVNRHRRVRPALGRVVAAIAKRREAA